MGGLRAFVLIGAAGLVTRAVYDLYAAPRLCAI
jgi:hypothetical protein